MMKNLLPTRALYAIFALLLLYARSSVSAAQGGYPAGKQYGNKDNWKLISAGNKTVQSLADLTDGVYFLQLSDTRLDCDKTSPDEYLGFNNRTCSASLATKTTAGPVMRQRSKSMMWREWMIQVYESTEEQAIISLQAFIRPDVQEEARCLGFISNFYGNSEFKETCTGPTYGSGVFLNGTRDNSELSPQKWTVKSTEGTIGGFEITALNKPDVCLRMLAAKGCASQAILVESPVKDESGSQQYTTWKFVKEYDLAPDASPPPLAPVVPSPSFIPLVPTEIPGPKISAPSSTSSGTVDVVVESLGGSEACSVVSVKLVSLASTVGATPNEVEVSTSRQDLIFVSVSVPVTGYGYNRIYAYGVCSTGEKTEISNQLSVYYSDSTPIASNPPKEALKPIVIRTAITQGDKRRRLLQSETIENSRCFIGADGNLTSCIDAGLGNETIIESGVVDPLQRWITFLSKNAQVSTNFTTCGISPIGIVDQSTCGEAWAAPSGYGIAPGNNAFDPPGRRVWFVLQPEVAGRISGVNLERSSLLTSREAWIRKFLARIISQEVVLATCAIDAQGRYSGCAQSDKIQAVSIVGSAPDASGFYIYNYTAENTQFCKNDLSFPCASVSGFPAASLKQEADSSLLMGFLTDNVVYITGMVSNQPTLATYRCNVVSTTAFSDCVTVVDESTLVKVLVASVNSGKNAYITVVDANGDWRGAFEFCDINQSSGKFENCKPVFDEDGVVTFPLDIKPTVSSPIVI